MKRVVEEQSSCERVREIEVKRVIKGCWCGVYNVEEMSKKYVSNVEISWGCLSLHVSVDFGFEKATNTIKLMLLSLYGLYMILSVKIKKKKHIVFTCAINQCLMRNFHMVTLLNHRFDLKLQTI